ncbi:MAG: ComF family protein [Thermoanaerobaculia bacterium]
MLAEILDLLLPAYCLACRSRLPPAGSTLGLCARCRGRLLAVDPAASCPRCARPLPLGAREPEPCGACRDDPPAFDRLIGLWRYRSPAVDLVHALKFRRCEFLAEAAGLHLAGAVRGRGISVDLVVPVPLHWTRRLRRGYDQAEAIAIAVARDLGSPMASALRRVSATRAQARLPRDERRRNLARAFTTRRGVSVRGLRILLVDDVFTTGATSRAAARALERGGAAAVSVAVLAVTPAGESDVDTIRECLVSDSGSPFSSS